MSMWLSIARVSKETFNRIKAEPKLIDAIFFDTDDDAKSTLADLGIAADHTGGVDYRSATEGLEAMAEATGEEIDEDDPVFGDLGVSGTLDYDAGYGPAFFVDPAATKKKAKDAIVCHMDDEVGSLIKGAATDGDYLVGVVS